MRSRIGLALATLLLAPVAARAAETHAYVLTSDFSSGGLSAVDLASRAVSKDVATVYDDARVRWYGGLLYVVNRFGQDNIQIVDPAHGYTTVRQFSVGNGSNPQDIAVMSSTKAYVTRLASSRLLIVDPSTGDSTGAIPLGAFADADGIPEMDRMIVVGDRLFVSLERLSNFQPTDRSLVVAIDTQADTVIDADPATPGIQAITLPGTNPVTRFCYDPVHAKLAIGCVGSYGALDGGVALVDPFALVADGWAITESALGGDVLDVTLDTPTRAFAIVSDAAFNTSLVAWDPSAGQPTGTVFAPGGFSLADMGLDDAGELYVCDNDFTAPGLWVFAAATGATLAGPLDTGLPPVEVAFDRAADPAAVLPPAGGAATVALAAPWPQPSTGGVRASLSLARPATVRVAVLDPQGRRVRELAAGPMAPGVHELRWDGRDAAGRLAPAGVYELAARIDGRVESRRIVIAR